MAVKYLFPLLAVVFLVFAGLRILRDGARITPASRTWLIIGILFALVGAYLGKFA